MAKPKIEWNSAGFTEVMRSAGVQRLLKAEADRVARTAGDGYESELGTGGRTRSRAWARAATGKAIRDNAKNATLLRALGR